MATVELPLFPLSSVLFPGGPLLLRIFEPRYMSMVSRCMREGHGFGVLLIESGSEVGAARFVSVGTVAEIVDWHQRRDGLLGIEAEGRERFRVVSWRQQKDGLYVGELEMLVVPPATALPEDGGRLRGLVQGLLDEADAQTGRTARVFEDSSWLVYRLAELLPIPAETRQAVLELEDVRERLGILQPHLEQLEAQPSRGERR